MESTTKIKELGGVFLRLGLTSFGGPAAHIAMMKKEIVDKRDWIEEERFLDLMGAVNLIPGPNSTELAIHIGYERSGWRGLIVSGICFILPAVLITGLFAWIYKLYGQLPEIQPFIYGIKPAVIAIIISAIFPLLRKAMKTIELTIIGVTILVLSYIGLNEIILLFGAGIAMILIGSLKKKGNNGLPTLFPFFLESGFILNTTLDWKLFFIFLKVGAILYGSGYVLFAFLDAELVGRGMLTREQLIDAIAVGQFTPGPVFSSVTFIGWQINGISGAVASTFAIFLPSFIFVAVLGPLVRIMQKSIMMRFFLDGVNVASLAIILCVCYLLAIETIIDWRTLTIAVLSIFITFKYMQINSAYIVLGGAVAGYILSFL